MKLKVVYLIMSLNKHFIIVLLISAIWIMSCCQKDDCSLGTTIHLRFVKDSINILDSSGVKNLELYNSSSNEIFKLQLENPTEVLTVMIEDGIDYQLSMDTLLNITFKASLRLEDDDDCCDQFAIDKFYVDGQINCESQCDTVVINL